MCKLKLSFASGLLQQHQTLHKLHHPVLQSLKPRTLMKAVQVLQERQVSSAIYVSWHSPQIPLGSEGLRMVEQPCESLLDES